MIIERRLRPRSTLSLSPSLLNAVKKATTTPTSTATATATATAKAIVVESTSTTTTTTTTTPHRRTSPIFQDHFSPPPPCPRHNKRRRLRPRPPLPLPLPLPLPYLPGGLDLDLGPGLIDRDTLLLPKKSLKKRRRGGGHNNNNNKSPSLLRFARRAARRYQADYSSSFWDTLPSPPPSPSPSPSLPLTLHIDTIMGAPLSTAEPTVAEGSIDWGSPLASSLRARAETARLLRIQRAIDSRAAWEAGDKRKAGVLSAEGKQAAAEYDKLSLQAEEEIFRIHNPGYPSSSSSSSSAAGGDVGGGGGLWGYVLGWMTSSSSSSNGGDGAERLARLDLHRLFVKEALARAQEHVKLCRKMGVGKTNIVTGRGNNSAGGVARVKPEIEKWLMEERLEVVWTSEGSVEVVLLLPAGAKVEGGEGWGAVVWKVLFGQQ